MEATQFLELTLTNVILLFIVGFIAGLVSGFIGAGAAFVLTPAMMSLGVPGIVAVASNMAHKFPKALVGSIKRAKFGQVDLKLGLIMGLFAEVGVFVGKELMTNIRSQFGDIGTDLYVSAVFVVVLGIIGTIVLRDGLRETKDSKTGKKVSKKKRLAQWVQSIHIPGTMVHLKSINTSVSVLIIAPMGFATGLLAASIAVGGFIGVPAMMYILGLPAIMASATELVVAFVMGMGGSIFYAWEGFVDIRLSMIILAGSLFGLQLGAIGTTYVKDYTVKFVMSSIMLIVLLSRMVIVPVYLSSLNIYFSLSTETSEVLTSISKGILVIALVVGAGSILSALVKGMAAHKSVVKA